MPVLCQEYIGAALCSDHNFSISASKGKEVGAHLKSSQRRERFCEIWLRLWGPGPVS